MWCEGNTRVWILVIQKHINGTLLAYQYCPINEVLDDQDPDSGIPFTSDGAFLRLLYTVGGLIHIRHDEVLGDLC